MGYKFTDAQKQALREKMLAVYAAKKAGAQPAKQAVTPPQAKPNQPVDQAKQLQIALSGVEMLEGTRANGWSVDAYEVAKLTREALAKVSGAEADALRSRLDQVTK